MPTYSPIPYNKFKMKLSDFIELSNLREDYFKAVPEICVERPALLTNYHRNNDLFGGNRLTVLEKARAYRFALENRQPVVRHEYAYEKKGSNLVKFKVRDTSPFAGSTTAKFKGVILYPELLGLTIWPELGTVKRRKTNPYYIDDEEIDDLNFNVFPYWMDRNILEITRSRCFEENCTKGLGNCAPEIKLMQNLVFFLDSKALCISHTIPDFTQVLSKGLKGMIQEAESKKAASKAEQRDFYQALIEVMEGIVAYSLNLSAEAKKLADKASNIREKTELQEIANIYGRIPKAPAATFREGLTAIWICWMALHLENANVGLSLGRLDQVLYELFKNERKNGLSIEEAVRLVCYLWLKIGDHVPLMPETGEKLFGGTGSNQAITIGGIDKEGKDAVNELTYVILKATELMKLRDPNLNARYYHGINDEEYLRSICEVNVDTGATPAVHNDRAIIHALDTKQKKEGVKPEQSIEWARDYGVVGCVEPSSNGRQYGHSGAVLINLTAALELALFNGRHRHTGLDRQIGRETGLDFKDFEAFQGAFETQLNWICDQAVQLNNMFGKVHQDFYPTPILSTFFEGPMESGKDLIQGGAKINTSAATVIGFADTADSLNALEKWVFKDKKIKLDEMRQALQENFAGREQLRIKLSNPATTPKYGNDYPPGGNANAKWLATILDKKFGGLRNYRGGPYRVGYWTMTIHAGLGRILGALPNGRRKGANLASGITPVSGITHNLSAMLNSVGALPAEALSGGVALNIKYTPKPGEREKFIKDMMDRVKAYFAPSKGVGGLEIQFNIIDREALIEAVRTAPEELLVRVSGYTAYFKDLNDQMQREIIERTEYDLFTGEMQTYTIPGNFR